MARSFKPEALRIQPIFLLSCCFWLSGVIHLIGADAYPTNARSTVSPYGVSLTNLRSEFFHPPHSVRPWVYWFWLDGNVTREGITADLESIARVGLAGVILLDCSQYAPQGPVLFNSPEWRELFKHALNEASRLGLELTLHNGAGYSGSGGPWVTPELAAQKVISSKTNLTGPYHYQGPLLPLPKTAANAFDIATLAFPTLESDGPVMKSFSPTVSASIRQGFDREKLMDGNSKTFATIPTPTLSKPQYIQISFKDPFTASVLKLNRAGQNQSFNGSVQVSDNGKSFRKIRDFHSKDGGIDLALDQVNARHFRLLFLDASPGLTTLSFSEILLAPQFRVQWGQAKTGLGPLPPNKLDLPYPTNIPPAEIIASDKIIDLTTNINHENELNWDVPPGQWTLMRFAYQPVGTMNHPPSKGGEGLECDKLSREAVQAHFKAFLEPLVEHSRDMPQKSFTGAFIESWEVGFQNWTPHFREEFQKRRGYDLLKYLPVFSDRFVNSPEQTERFMWDMRRTIADLVADNYAGEFNKLAHQNGLELFIEGYGNGPLENLQYAGRADIPMSEFWVDHDDPDRFHHSRAMAWAAHTYGKPLVAAESFTAQPESGRWQNHFFSIKPVGDGAFCAGVNRMVIHRFAHQPWLNRRPGMTMGACGLHYERTETWWEQSKAWHDYLARCQLILQRGLFCADICYLSTENAYLDPPSKSQLIPAPPKGYECDVASPEVLLKRMTVKDGRLSLPDGMNYRLLVLPPSKTMTPALLRKIKELVESGATVVGLPLAKSPSLADFPNSDKEVNELARKLWGPEGNTRREHQSGKGKIVWDVPLEQVLKNLGVPFDFEQRTPIAGYPLNYIHRAIEGSDFYFVANSNLQPVVAECVFRGNGTQPELWHPDTGIIEKPAVWREESGRTIVPLKFDPAGSMFVVFPKGNPPLESVTVAKHDGKLDPFVQLHWNEDHQLELLANQPGTYEFSSAKGRIAKTEVKSVESPMTISGPWQLTFQPDSGAPDHIVLEKLISWSAHKNPGVKYFSGAATYKTTFTLPGFKDKNREFFVDLGTVQILAELKLNGHDFGILWKPPFRADVTEALKAGDNSLEIKVVNLWPNRLIGDAQLPEDCEWVQPYSPGVGVPLVRWPQWLLHGKPSPTGRLTFSTWKHWTKDSPLLESGLLGPVILHIAEKRSISW